MPTHEFDYSPPLYLLNQESANIKLEDIERWENENHINLPAEYRNFLFATNGGSLRPYLFELQLNDDEITDTKHGLNYFYPIVSAVEKIELTEVTIENEVTNVLKIAKAISGFEIVLLLDDKNFGKISALSINSAKTSSAGQEVWELIKVSESFLDFLSLLKDDSDNSIYHPIWQSPSEAIQERLRKPQKLVVENNKFEIIYTT